MRPVTRPASIGDESRHSNLPNTQIDLNRRMSGLGPGRITDVQPIFENLPRLTRGHNHSALSASTGLTAAA